MHSLVRGGAAHVIGRQAAGILGIEAMGSAVGAPSLEPIPGLSKIQHQDEGSFSWMDMHVPVNIYGETAYDIFLVSYKSRALKWPLTASLPIRSFHC